MSWAFHSCTAPVLGGNDDAPVGGSGDGLEGGSEEVPVGGIEDGPDGGHGFCRHKFSYAAKIKKAQKLESFLAGSPPALTCDLNGLSRN